MLQVQRSYTVRCGNAVKRNCNEVVADVVVSVIYSRVAFAVSSHELSSAESPSHL